ncbi:Methyltransferase FkbM family [Sterolibacterium denitrificans]|uniref:Methyltransferase FkbM family n=2 Tax=Sterolibacterium denitrificans TaxID=157592 RepID=A0A7Z7MUP5_9PROT|nr:Methyltransferase FkbM family [Sterolibacterium denitrificans]
MRLDWIFYRLADKLFGQAETEGRRAYSQCGEDLIVRNIFDALKIPAPSYLDIGAHHPYRLSNTYLFYSTGSHGVNIEPDPELYEHFHKARPRDTNLNIGIGERSDMLRFFVMNPRALNTFSPDEAEKLVKEGFRIEREQEIQVLPVNSILEEYFCEAAPDFVSIDVEGLDLQVLQGFDFTRWRPKVFCVETITYSSQRAGKKIPEIAELLHGNDYFSYADTWINTLFVDRRIW